MIDPISVVSILVALVLLYVIARALSTPFFWSLLLVGAVIYCLVAGWQPIAIAVVVVAALMRFLMRRRPFDHSPPAFIADARDPHGRPFGDPYFYKGPPGPHTNYR